MRHRKATLTIEGMPLVSVPIGLATTRKRTSDVSLSIVFEDGRKAVTRYANPVTGEIVEARPEHRGVKVGADEHGDIYGLIDTEAWSELNADIKLHVLGFVPVAEVASRLDRIEDAHYVQVQPGFDGSALGMVAKAMTKRKVAAAVRFAVGTRERMGALVVRGDGALVVLTLAYSASVAQPDDEVLAPAQATVGKDAVAQAGKLIDTLLAEGALLDTLTDDTLAERKRLVQAAAEGKAVLPKPVKAAAKPTDGNALAAAIAASIG